MLVIVTHELDPHADAVMMVLRRDGFGDILRIDLETVGTRFTLKIEPVSGGCLIHSRDVADRRCASTDLTTIWWRRSGRLGISAERSLNPTPETLDATEIYHGVKWMLESLPAQRFPLGHPDRMRPAENKILQLQVASELGFKTPAPLFTNHAAHLGDFTHENGDLVIKPLKTSYVYRPDDQQSISLYAHRCTGEEALALSGDEPGFALYCQTRIEKKADIRVNVFPSEAVACRIDNNALGDAVDWRPTTMKHDHEIVSLPPALEAQCRAFLERMGLRWGAFDFALTPDDKWIFFECNPNGQWLWIQTKTGFPISEIIARELLQHHRQGKVAHN